MLNKRKKIFGNHKVIIHAISRIRYECITTM